MKRASFRLQPVLELRRTQERTAALAAAQAASTAAEADRQATERETELATAVLPPSLSAGEFLATMTLFRLAADDASAARSLATATAEQAELVRSQWTEAAQRTKGLERLRERHQRALDAAEAAAEGRALDDLVTGRAGRTGASPRIGTDETEGSTPWTE